jgi:hypothetical protein
VNPPDPKAGAPTAFEAFEPARFAMGDTVRFAERIGLIEMEPRADLGSTGYLLANPRKEYLALQPEAGAAFHADAGAGQLRGGVVQCRRPRDRGGGTLHLLPLAV